MNMISLTKHHSRSKFDNDSYMLPDDDFSDEEDEYEEKVGEKEEKKTEESNQGTKDNREMKELRKEKPYFLDRML